MSRAAIRYATAILDLAKEQNLTDTVHDEMQSILKTVKASDDLSELLTSPLVKAEVKNNALKAVFSKAGGITHNLFDVLLTNKRISILPAVASSFIALYEQDKGSQVATVTTAVPLTEDLAKQVSAKVKELTGKEATLKSVVDESIIGGFILRVGDLQYNASISSQLANLKRSFNDNSFESKL